MKEEKSIKQSLIKYILLFIAFFIAFTFFWTILLTQEDHPKQSFEKKFESEIALILISSSKCKYCQDPLLSAYIEDLEEKLKNFSEKNSYGFTTIGISNEINTIDGINHLSEIISFDEISIGNSLRNSTIQRYVWESYEKSFSVSTPQVIITIRNFHINSLGGIKSIHPKIERERIIIRRSGLDNIRKINNVNFLETL